MIAALRKLLCEIGIHRWGRPRDWFPAVPSEADCARVFYGDGAWPNYPYRSCDCCGRRKNLAKTYASVELSAARTFRGANSR